MTESYRPQPVPDQDTVPPVPQYGEIAPEGQVPPVPQYAPPTPPQGYTAPQPQYAEQPQYQGGYPQQAPYSAPYPAVSPRKARGEEYLKKAQIYLFVGLGSLFFITVGPIIFGILGLKETKKAQECGVDPGPWRIFAIVEIVVGSLYTALVIVYMVFILSIFSAGALTSV